MVLDLHIFKKSTLFRGAVVLFCKRGPFHISSLAFDHAYGRLGAMEGSNFWVDMAEELKGVGLECFGLD